MDEQQAQEKQSTLEQILAQRREKIARIREMGFEPYPYAFDVSHKSREITDHYEALEGKSVAVAGRLMTIRRMGKASFAHLQDAGGRIQLYVSRNDIGEKTYEMFMLLDIGDIVGVRGVVMKTRTGEITVKVDALTLLSKNIRPLPIVKEKDGVVYDAFADKELRYRHRYLDLIVNPEIKDVFIKRSAIIRATRDFFDSRGYLEVETPILQPLYGGANARPFITHHNSLNTDLFLRIADELYLKRLIVGGFDRVYEFSRNFRNEGMDRNHNPEFTAIEFYQAYVDYYYMMDLVEHYFRHIAETLGSPLIEYQGESIDFSKPFARRTMAELFHEYLGIDLGKADETLFAAWAREHHFEYDPKWNYGQFLDKLFDEFIEPKLLQPTFVLDYPKAISPLAKVRRDGDPRFVERFELFICAAEYVNAFSELNDPLDQRERLEGQDRLRALGDDEAQMLDEDFIRAIETGMPPTGGVGIGLDRVIMLFTGQSTIKDVLLFPAMRPEKLS
ncbi:MAG: lysine--tRNA ligase [Candidatus Neomarinimicrobiota bacterium]|jgi:lysyl-tRNA synthetase class 2|nr:lysine--tRNA ligase [Candidatus Neomarinimicrobiota bacterium]MDD3966907.1 lysine--tRNA ligase [Candidatus Neomarinimicrobiota bacterium]MDX9780297.1 lysine--tRNA ligase [bacterium]